MKNLFEPRSIAVIGASHHQGKIGYRVVENIVKGGYKGGVYPINPRGGKIAGINAHTSIHEVIGDVDVAVIAIPAVHVLDAVKSCAKKHVKYLVIITSGFSEIGNSAEEKKIVNYAREHGMRVLGPNVFGFYSSKVSLNASFGPGEVRPGNVSIVTQSGAIGIAMVGKTKVERIGLSNIISVGNKADIDETDLLSYLMEQGDTRMILMYIEGIKGGARLVEVLREAARRKPVVVIKSGRSARGAMAAASHTGSLAGADEVFDDIMRQCGVIRAERIQEALEWCKFLSNAPEPKGSNTVIITNGGGVGVMAADACERYGLHLYDDMQALKKLFSASVPEFGSTKNPIDLTGAAKDSDYERALAAALKNKQIHSVICLGCETAMFDAEKFTGMVRKKNSAYRSVKPVVFSVFGGDMVEKGITRLRREGVPIFSDVYAAVSCLGALHSHHSRIEVTREGTDLVKLDVRAINHMVKNARNAGRNFLLAHQGREVMGALGIRVPQSKVARDIDAAVKCAEEIGYPVVMKVLSKDILHKSDVGGVALDLDNRNEVIEAYESIMHSARAHVPHAHIAGVEIDEMVTKGIETIVGARMDRSFGPIVMFGLGGVYVEVMKDVSFRAFPLSSAEALSMVRDVKSYPLLLGVRGEERKDIEGVVDAIRKVGNVIAQCPDISDIEINPLVVYEQGDGVKAVDVRVMIKGVNP